MKKPKSPSSQPSRENASEESWEQGPAVLLVDDNRDLLRFLERLMAGAGWYLTAAESATEARRCAAGKRFDVALLDYMLPDGNGVEIGVEFRQRVPEMVVVIMTSSILPPEEEALCEEFEFPVLRKPFLASDVMNQIRHLLKGRLPAGAGPRPEMTCCISFLSDGQRYANELGERLKAAGVHLMERTSGGHYGNLADALIVVGTRDVLHSRQGLYDAENFQNRGKVIWIGFENTATQANAPRTLENAHYLEESRVTLRKGPTPEVLNKLLELFKQLKRPLNEGKLILVGRGEVGKTSIVRRLVQGRFNENESKTRGIQIINWLIRCDDITFRLNIWDFGGQEIMHSTHQFFLTRQSLYILVLNGREGGEDVDAEYWLKLIETFGGDSPVIVVQNKIAEHPFELNYRGLRARYPQIREFVRTDCRDNIGLDRLREQIESAVAAMPEIRMPFPFEWLKVKQRLESMREDYLGQQAFVDLCAAEGVSDSSEREALGFMMHCLGIALNYHDDPRLLEARILKPEWVTHGIYDILGAQSVADRRGELHLQDLQMILPAKKYPLDKHLFLIELMRKFSLCFPFQDDPHRYLVPELLGKEEPEEAAIFEPEDCLNFEYYYRVLPEGLLPRFIARTHTLSRGQQRWHSGVVLSHQDAVALVKTELSERRVLVRVRGGDAVDRRKLLAIIRFDLDRIHAEFNDRLEAQAKVPLAAFPAHSIDYKKLVMFDRRGIKEFPEFIDGRIVDVHVSDLLNGIDFEEQRIESVAELSRAKSIFLSYSHKDEGLRDELETHLKLLQRQRVVSLWYDRKILPGGEWEREIDHRIEHAAIILLLISPDFLASDYCFERELTRALERHAAGEAIVVPVLVRPCDWKRAPFAKLQGLPKSMKPVKAWRNRDAAWTEVAVGIREIAERLQSST